MLRMLILNFLTVCSPVAAGGAMLDDAMKCPRITAECFAGLFFAAH
jgi:hypothetical protein